MATPDSTVTFTVITGAGAPTFTPPAEGIRILGATSSPALAGKPDPLSDWDAAAPGFNLTPLPKTDPDSLGFDYKVWRGTLTVPQGAALEFKAVYGSGSTVHFERAGGANRTFVVPASPTADVRFTWEN
jgi:hypothetical protein